MTVHLAGPTGARYAIKMVGANTVGVLGKIAPVTTAGRPTPPQPYNGFNTVLTPFGNGHVFALSLGGTDEPRNLVPQWEQWQETGAWRIMENTCGLYPGKIFRCDITYDTSLLDRHHTLHTDFNTKQQRLIDWQGPNLPTRFEVSVHDCALDLSKIVTDSDYDDALKKLTPLTRVQGVGKFDADVTKMPDDDRKYWISQMGTGAAKTVHSNFVDDQKMDVESNGLVFERTASLNTFSMFPESMVEIRSELAAQSGVLKTEADQFMATELFQKDSTKRIAKRQAEFQEKYGTASGFKKREAATVARRKTARELRAAQNRGLSNQNG